jgi:predicted DNA-binding protein
MSKKKPTSIYTALRIPPELREQAMDKATKDGRTLSNYIKHLIREDLTDAGLIARKRVRYSKGKKK